VPVNGFAAGKRLWVEIVCGSIRVDFIGKLLYVTETDGPTYCLQFHDGFTLSFKQADLEAGRVACRETRVPEGQK